MFQFRRSLPPGFVKKKYRRRLKGGEKIARSKPHKVGENRRIIFRLVLYYTSVSIRFNCSNKKRNEFILTVRFLFVPGEISETDVALSQYHVKGSRTSTYIK